MAIKYDRLFSMLKEKGITKTQFQNKLGVSSTTIAKMAKNEAVSMKIIEQICKLLNCQPGDILSLEEEKTENLLLKSILEESQMHLKGGIYHYIQINFAYNSNHIEGSRLSADQTRYIYETNSILQEGDSPANVDDIMETINHFQCFDFLLEHVEDEISEYLIKKLHEILKQNTSDSRKDWFRVGDYKTKPNMIGERRTTAPSKVKGEIARLLIDYNQIENVDINDIIDFHYHFESIHPFQDGNGRVGRLLMFKECLKHNITPFIIDESHKLYYYRGLKEYENEKGYLTDTCLSAQDGFQDVMDYFMKEI